MTFIGKCVDKMAWFILPDQNSPKFGKMTRAHISTWLFKLLGDEGGRSEKRY